MSLTMMRYGNHGSANHRAPKKDRVDGSANHRPAPPLTASQLSSMKFSVATVSKWLTNEENSIFCNVVESGDILEVQGEADYHHWGIALRVPHASEGGAGGVEVACLRPVGASSRHDRSREGRVQLEALDVFWPAGAKVRINNRSDRTKQYHNEEVIRAQIQYALNHRAQKWHNCEHFAYWCRHGEVRGSKVRQATDVGVWGSLAATAGAWNFIRSRTRRVTE